MREPFKHQTEGRNFLVKKSKAILADQMGLGKSFTAIMAAIDSGENTLVLCPASLKTNWAREILQVDDNATITILNGAKEEPYSQGQGTNWLIVNYDIVAKEENRAKIKAFGFETVILDEAHYIKSSKSQRTKATLKIIKGAKRKYLLTGTPIMNRPEELYTLLQAIDHPLGASWYDYVLKYCGAYWRKFKRREFNPHTGKLEVKEKKFLDTNGATNLPELKTKIADVYLRRTKAILGADLPAKVITNVFVEMEKDDRIKYAQAWDEYMNYLENNPVIFSDLDDIEKMEKIENIKQARHLVELQKLKQVASQSKLKRIIEDVQNIVEQGEKVIIFTQYTQTLQDIKKALNAEKIETVSLSGEDDQNSRQLSIDVFQNTERVKCFVGNIKAAGVGITLTKASTVIFADLEWTPALHEQAEDRAHRIGQTEQVNVYYYIAKNTIEEDIVELLGKKNQIIKSILEGNRDRVGNMNVANSLIKKLSTR